MFDNMIVVYRNSCDVWFYVVGNQTENELILVNALMALYDALSSVLRCQRRRPSPPSAAHPVPRRARVPTRRLPLRAARRRTSTACSTASTCCCSRSTN